MPSFHVCYEKLAELLAAQLMPECQGPVSGCPTGSGFEKGKGWAFASCVRARRARQPVIIVTGTVSYYLRVLIF